MSPERNWRMRVEDILASIEKVREYTQGMAYEKFSEDGKTVDAVIRNLEIIGEAAGYIQLRSRKSIQGWPGWRCATCGISWRMNTSESACALSGTRSNRI